MQRIVYAKTPSDIIAKLRGTYSAPTTAPIASAGGGGGGGGISTDLQKSIFGAPPGTTTLPAKPGEKPAGEAPPPQGVKRTREGESDEEEAPMEEDSDVPMEASSDED